MRLKHKRGGVSPVIAIVLMVAGVVVLAAVLYVFIMGLPSDQREEICGDVLGEKKWFEILINQSNPIGTVLKALDQIPDLVNSIIDQLIFFKGERIGIVELFDDYGDLILSVALFTACHFVLQDDDIAYEDEPYERLDDTNVFIALLVGLKVEKPDMSVIYPSFEVELKFSFNGSAYNVVDNALDDGEELTSLNPPTFPCTIMVKEEEFFKSDGVCEIG